MRRRALAALGAGAALVLIAVTLSRRDDGIVLEPPTSDSSPRSAERAAAGESMPSPEPTLPEVTDTVTESEARILAVADEPGPLGAAPDTSSTVHFAGVAEDDVGRALVGHTIEVHALTSSRGRFEARALTNSSGRFRMDGVTPGPKRVVVHGPGEGDIWDDRPDGRGFHSRRIERELMLGIPEEGLDDFVLKSVDHTGILVTARVIDELGRPIGGWTFSLSHESGRSGMLWNTDGHLNGIVPVGAEGEFELRAQYRGGLIESNPLRDARYVPLAVRLAPTADRVDLGTLVLSRMSCLRLTLVDGTDGIPIPSAMVLVRCSGGGQPPVELNPEPGEDGSYEVRSGRSSGEYEIEVTAPGFRPARQVGVLVAGDVPQRLEVVLESGP